METSVTHIFEVLRELKCALEDRQYPIWLENTFFDRKETILINMVKGNLKLATKQTLELLETFSETHSFIHPHFSAPKTPKMLTN
jgi:hypothetical protein